MNPLLGPSDGTWSSRLGDSGWPDTGNNDSTDGKDWQPGAGGAAFTDLVPEFEPGKPWKVRPFFYLVSTLDFWSKDLLFKKLIKKKLLFVTILNLFFFCQMKSIEDDPSITPGSVVRSPLSLAAIKDTDAIFSTGSKTSPPPQSVNADSAIPSLSNSTWSFNPPATTPSVFTG